MFIINSAADLAAAIEFIRANEILAYDIETDGLNPRKNRIIGIGVSGALDGFYLPLYSYNTTLDVLLPIGDPNWAPMLLSALQGKKLLMFNGSFDSRFTKAQLKYDLTPSLYCDVMLLKHTCDENFPFGLKEIAAKVFGHEVLSEKQEMQASIKTNGGTATQYYKAATNLLAKYCVQDCLLTYRLYSYYSRDLQKQGLQHFFYQDEVMPLYKEVTIPMEELGVAMDTDALVQTNNEIAADIAALESTIQRAIEPHLELFTQWFLNKDYPVQTRTGKVPQYIKRHGTQYAAWRADNPTGYMFNLQSKHHLKKLFFDTLKCEPLSRTPTGQPQVDDEFIQSVAGSLPWAGLLTEYNKLCKLKGTYIERFLEEIENGRFYPSFAQHRTVSGRYAGDFQQLPRPLGPDQGTDLVRKYTNRIRTFVLSDPQSKLCSADYEQLEPTIFAHVSTDQRLQRIFTDGRDFYSEVAIRTEKMRDVSSDKSAPNYLGKVNKAARQRAKAYSLGIAYGMTGYKLKFELGVSEEEANKLVKDYLDAFPDLARWMNASKDAVTYKGEVRQQLGRVRHMPRAVTIFKRYGASIYDSLQLWKNYHTSPEVYKQVREDYKEMKNLLNNAINFQIQSLAASIVNRAAIAIVRELKSKGLKTALVGQIHDELLFNVPDSERDEAAALIKHIMENNIKLTVPLRTEPQFGNNFAQCK